MRPVAILVALCIAVHVADAGSCTSFKNNCIAYCRTKSKPYAYYNCAFAICECRDTASTECFSGMAIVTTPAGPKLMRDLRVGDAVLAVDDSGSAAFEPVLAFTSRRPSAQATFVCAAAGNRTTCATPRHLAFVGGLGTSDMVAFEDLRIGDHLVAKDGTMQPIESIFLQTAEGVFNVHTPRGRIVVDGFVQSELTSVMPPWTRRFAPAVIRTFPGFATNIARRLHGTSDADEV